MLPLRCWFPLLPFPDVVCVWGGGVPFVGAQQVDMGRTDFNLELAVTAQTITNGLKYSVATGNWGQQNVAGAKAGVSQVRRWCRGGDWLRVL